jgi:NTP pyrophosphatase (non-canonical NTP hydrolase)
LSNKDNIELSLSEFQRDCHKTSIDHGWWEGNVNVPEKLMLIVSEIAEALEDYRNGKNLTGVFYDSNDKPEGFAVELADAIIRILDLCGYLGIDLAEALSVKHAYNQSRPWRHGSKLA